MAVATVWFRFARSVSEISLFSLPLLRLPALGLWLGGYSALLCSVIYVGSTAAGYYQGFALPTTALMHWSGAAGALAGQDYAIAYLALTLVSLSIIASWLAVARTATAVALDERRNAAFIQRWGLSIALCLFVFSLSGAWAGIPRNGDSNASSIAGLVAFSDAHGYLASAQDQLKDGIWNAISMRRPLAAAFRSVLLIASGLSVANMLLLQTILACLTTSLATRAVIGWRGIYAGVAFFCISFLMYRSFFTTVLTEPLALCFGMLSVPFFINALRAGSLPHALFGLTLFTVGLFMRMGAMFVLPALVVWIVMAFGSGWVGKLRAAAAACTCVCAAALVNWLLARIYGVGPDLSGSNFSYTLCGLSIGDVWSACQERYSSSLVGLDESAQAKILYVQALHNILDHPTVFLLRLADGGARFIAFLPDTLLRGYLWNPMPVWFSRVLLLGTAAVGLLWQTYARREKTEALFWIPIGLGTIGSAAFVYYDSGMRVMSVVYPLIIAFVASGFSTPTFSCASKPLRLRSGIAALAVVAGSFVVLPSAAHVSLMPGRKAAEFLPGTHSVFGGRELNGFLIVDDAQTLPYEVPVIHFSDFKEIIRLSNLEVYQPLLNPRAPALPFGFIAAPRTEAGVESSNLYIVPADVMSRRDVRLWRFTIAEWQTKDSARSYWLLVTKATPLK